jgi:hypothetical protein
MPKVALKKGWELIATEAGRFASGLRAAVQVHNGTVQHWQTLNFGQPDKCKTFTRNVAKLTNLSPGAVRKKLLELAAGVEGSLREMGNRSETPRTTQAQRLVECAIAAGVELFHHEERAYATFPVQKHQETCALKEQRFRSWLRSVFYEAEKEAPGSQTMQEALNMLEAKALFENPEIPVFIRFAEHKGKIYLDLANEHWQVVEITAKEWRILDTPPVRFRRARGMKPLPVPMRGGTLADLRRFVNINRRSAWILLTAWLIAALRPRGPYTILVVNGEQGSGKSTLLRVLRSLVDPNQAALRPASRNEHDLMIAAQNGWILALDNLSHLPPWLSDALCRLATGTGFATRELLVWCTV